MTGESSPTGCLHAPEAGGMISFLILPPGVFGGGEEGGEENGFDSPSIGPGLDRLGLDVEADAEGNKGPSVSPGGLLPTELNRWRKNVAR